MSFNFHDLEITKVYCFYDEPMVYSAKLKDKPNDIYLVYFADEKESTKTQIWSVIKVIKEDISDLENKHIELSYLYAKYSDEQIHFAVRYGIEIAKYYGVIK